ncbi:hypothetical protein C9J27_03130 [Photobacterium kishitanii]|uniref:Uncharacterized protein n=1 Tax=Photobacterium kishitanii TaxID=318456 RepID=A0A2T3KML1_9GAMM|nr:hypothetical protein C9J27_03130 [Photobacterium kishitanii]
MMENNIRKKVAVMDQDTKHKISRIIRLSLPVLWVLFAGLSLIEILCFNLDTSNVILYSKVMFSISVFILAFEALCLPQHVQNLNKSEYYFEWREQGYIELFLLLVKVSLISAIGSALTSGYLMLIGSTFLPLIVLVFASFGGFIVLSFVLPVAFFCQRRNIKRYS